ncbi:MAG: hypothetical protein LBG93_00015 [Treponema sp.]|jgi:hypothetical protein|nr:hypothetical protein [Treponema sp.]
MMFNFANPTSEFILYLGVALCIAFGYMMIRRVKLSRLIKKNQLTNSVVFRFGIETSLAISQDGRIGVLNLRLQTIVIAIKEIVEFEVLLGRYCISNAKVSKNKGAIFSGISERLEGIFAEEERFKEIAFIVQLKNNKIFGINLFKTSRLKARVLPQNQKNILFFFQTLHAIEQGLHEK